MSGPVKPVARHRQTQAHSTSADAVDVDLLEPAAVVRLGRVQHDRREQGGLAVGIGRHDDRVRVAPVDGVAPQQRLLPGDAVGRLRKVDAAPQPRHALAAPVVVIVLVPALEEAILRIAQHVERAAAEVRHHLPRLIVLDQRVVRVLDGVVETPGDVLHHGHDIVVDEELAIGANVLGDPIGGVSQKHSASGMVRGTPQRNARRRALVPLDLRQPLHDLPCPVAQAACSLGIRSRRARSNRPGFHSEPKRGICGHANGHAVTHNRGCPGCKPPELLDLSLGAHAPPATGKRCVK